MFGLFRIKQPAALEAAYAERDEAKRQLAYWQTRALTVGRLSQELRRERDEARAALANAYVRGPRGHFQRASLPLPPAPEAAR